MIWRLLTSFSVLAGLAHAATIAGRVSLRDSKLDSVSKRHDYSGVVVSLKPVNGADARSTAHVQMLQKNKTFTPHVLPVITGTTVDFPNMDPIFHNAFSSYSGQIFDIGLYPPGTSRSIRFARPGAVRVFCNIHPSMSAIILVLDTPYFARTGADGSFKIEAPPGEYELRVFHERATQQALDGLNRRISVEGDTTLPPLSLSEAGYLTAPRKDKYGKPYPPASADGSVYPGARN